MYDQEYYTVHAMPILANVYQTVQYVRSLQGHDIHRLTPQHRRLLRYLLDNKLWQM